MPQTAPVNFLPRTTRILEEGMSSGLHIGAQVYVAHKGNTVADFAIGEAKPGVAMTADTLTLWLSACKPIGAIAIARLLEKNRLGLDDPAADFLPEFAVNGKESVTLRHLLTHTAGLRLIDTGWPLTPWAETLERICNSSLETNWKPGRRARYDAATSWFVLGEVVRRVDGRPYEIYIRDEIFEPLGMLNSWNGMPPARYERYGDRIGVLYMTDKSPIRPLCPFDSEAGVISCRPSANGRGPMRELGRFYQMLLNGGTLDGTTLLKPQTVTLFTSAQRIGMHDETFRHKIDWGLGFLICSNKYGYKALPYSFGPHASDRAFGHNGFQSSMAFADPDHQLVIAVAPNGTPGEPAHDRRLRSVLGAIYEDLNLVTTD